MPGCEALPPLVPAPTTDPTSWGAGKSPTLYISVCRERYIAISKCCLPGVPWSGSLWGSSPWVSPSEWGRGRGRVAPYRVGDPAGGAAVRADSRQSRRPQGLIVRGCAVPASQPCSLPPCRCPPPRGLQSLASGSHSSGDGTLAGDGARDPQTGMGHGTPSQRWGTRPLDRDGAGDPQPLMGQRTPSQGHCPPSMMLTGAQRWKSSAPEPPSKSPKPPEPGSWHRSACALIPFQYYFSNTFSNTTSQAEPPGIWCPR